MPNRSLPPTIHTVNNLDLSFPEEYKLDCGIPVYTINMGTQDVVKMDFICKAGRPYEKKKMVARAALTMIKEGTQQYSAAELAQQLDFYGSTLSFPVNLDTANIELYCLTKYFEKTSALLAEMIIEPIFPKKELDSYKENSRQRLLVELAQPDVIAYRTITECLFGTDHPYGYNSLPESYSLLNNADLIDHWRNCFVARQCTIILSGKVDARLISILNKSFKNMPDRLAPPPYFPPKAKQDLPQKIALQQEGAVQTAIRIGTRLNINRHHEDFRGLLVLNTLLGGYFGSRLMTNIREEKGYTYNIYATVDALHEDSYFCIATEVSNDKVTDTLKEIYSELNKLLEVPIEEDELQMVRNYMLGNLLNMLDGPFNVSNVIKTIISESLDYRDFELLAIEIKTVTAVRLQQLARKYLQPKKMWEVVVGG